MLGCVRKETNQDTLWRESSPGQVISCGVSNGVGTCSVRAIICMYRVDQLGERRRSQGAKEGGNGSGMGELQFMPSNWGISGEEICPRTKLIYCGYT